MNPIIKTACNQFEQEIAECFSIAAQMALVKEARHEFDENPHTEGLYRDAGKSAQVGWDAKNPADRVAHRESLGGTSSFGGAWRGMQGHERDKKLVAGQAAKLKPAPTPVAQVDDRPMSGVGKNEKELRKAGE